MYNMYVRSFSIGVAVGKIKGREKRFVIQTYVEINTFINNRLKCFFKAHLLTKRFGNWFMVLGFTILVPRRFIAQDILPNA